MQRRMDSSKTIQMMAIFDYSWGSVEALSVVLWLGLWVRSVCHSAGIQVLGSKCVTVLGFKFLESSRFSFLRLLCLQVRARGIAHRTPLYLHP
jgi:hypothetical protein